MMKRIARLSTLLMALMLAATATGCGTSSEQASEGLSPSQVAPLYLEAMRGNVSGLQEHNPDTEITEEGVFGSANASMLETWGVSPTAEQEAQLTEAMLAGLAQAEFSVVDEKVDGDSATVTVAIQGLDMSSSLDTQFATIGGQITADTPDEDIIAVLDKAWREAPLVPEATDVEMQYTAVSDGRWIADPQGGEAAASAYVQFGG